MASPKDQNDYHKGVFADCKNKDLLVCQCVGGCVGAHVPAELLQLFHCVVLRRLRRRRSSRAPYWDPWTLPPG